MSYSPRYTTTFLNILEILKVLIVCKFLESNFYPAKIKVQKNIKIANLNRKTNITKHSKMMAENVGIVEI